MGFWRRVVVAFRAFFSLLGSGRLPDDVLAEAVATRDKTAPGAEATLQPQEVSGVEPGDGAILLLSVLQREGRLVDFLMEDLSSYSDAQIGAAVRDVHANCRRALTDGLELEPILDGAEDQPVIVPMGFEPSNIKLVGRVVGGPPFRGVLRHRGWRSSSVQLPSLAAPGARQIVAPAEVEVS